MQDSQSGFEQELLFAARNPNRPVPCDRHVATLADGYAIQRNVARHHNLPVMVWKLGLTGEGARESFGASEPIVGRLPASVIYSDRSEISFCGQEMFAEAELVFELGHDLPEQAHPYTRSDLCAALKGVYAGIEIVRSRFENSDLSLTQLVADNSMAHGLVLGNKIADGWDDRFSNLPASLALNGEKPTSGSTALVYGNPLDALVWLANWLRANEGETLKREQLVASGTCTGATEFHPGDTISVCFDQKEMARVSVEARH